jgi:hypothetical protein
MATKIRLKRMEQKECFLQGGGGRLQISQRWQVY